MLDIPNRYSIRIIFLSGCFSQMFYRELVSPRETHQVWQADADSAQINTDYAAGRAKGYRNAIEYFPYYYKY